MLCYKLYVPLGYPEVQWELENRLLAGFSGYTKYFTYGAYVNLYGDTIGEQVLVYEMVSSKPFDMNDIAKYIKDTMKQECVLFTVSKQENYFV
jgi:hypothetical protein